MSKKRELSLERKKRTLLQCYLFLFPLQSNIIAVLQGRQHLTDETHAKLWRAGVWLPAQLWGKCDHSHHNHRTHCGWQIQFLPCFLLHSRSYYNNLWLARLNTKYLCSQCKLVCLFWLEKRGSKPLLWLFFHVTQSNLASYKVCQIQQEKAI